jgi:DNA-directed RNA polymerase subunit RPC12/RpoP
MSDIYFKCECGKSLAVDEAGIGRTVCCVDCGKPVVVPEPDFAFSCPNCGATLLAPDSIAGDLIKCAFCGHRMTVPSITEAPSTAAPIFSPWRALRRQRRSEEPSVVKYPPASSPSHAASAPSRVACDASRVMASLMARRGEFTFRRKPPRRSIFADPKLSSRLFRVAVAALTLVVVAEAMRDVFRNSGSAPDGFSDVSASRETEDIRSPELIACDTVMSHDEPGASHHGEQAGESAPEVAIRELKDETFRCEQQTDSPSISHPAVPEPGISHSEVSVPPPPVLLAASPAEPDEELPLVANSDANSDADPAKPEVSANGKGDFRLMDRVIAACESIEKDRSLFDKLVPRLWSELIGYTSAHSGRALDDKDWEVAFRIAGEMVLNDPALTYEQSLALMEQGVHVLRNARPEDNRIAVRLAMCLAMTHADRWRRTNLQTNAAIIVPHSRGTAKKSKNIESLLTGSGVRHGQRVTEHR